MAGKFRRNFSIEFVALMRGYCIGGGGIPAPPARKGVEISDRSGGVLAVGRNSVPSGAADDQPDRFSES
jgi:hypothetical protein